MWQLKPAKRMLDALWTAGELVVSGRMGFQRIYDLPERVLIPSVLAAPVPSERETLRALIVRAVCTRGALTVSGILDHYRMGGGAKRILPHIAALCRGGKLKELAVADDGPPVYVPTETDPAGAEAPAGAVLLSPFDNLLWDRSFTRRLFGFDHVIEVYKPESDRIYGYYVLPLLVGSRIVGRADLKAFRHEGLLCVKAFHTAPHVRKTAALTSHFERALHRLARSVGLARIGGDLSSPSGR
jgi:uncharacterized protein YcaQ